MYAFLLDKYGSQMFYFIIRIIFFYKNLKKYKKNNFSVDANFDSTYPSNLVVYNTGDISWVPPGIFKISCKIDIKWFFFFITLFF